MPSKNKALSFLKKRNKRLLCLACMTASFPAAGQSVALKAPSRDFGYLVGDVIVTEATIATAGRSKLDERSLPVPGPLNAAIELRRIDVLESDAQKTVLRMEYQSFLAPEQVTQAELPGFDIHLNAGVAHVPAWLFHVSPLRVAQRAVDDAAALHGNLAISPRPLQPASMRLLISATIAALAAVAFAGLQGSLPGLGRKARPFAAAAHRIAKLQPSQTEMASRSLLHAFDAACGRHVFAADLDDVLPANRMFADLEPQIRQFFELAQRMLFAPHAPGCEGDFASIVRLAKALRRAERRW